MSEISLAERNLIILEYEQEQNKLRRARKAKTKPLSEALKYAGDKWGRNGCRCCQHTKWYKDIWPVICSMVCKKFGCSRQTKLNPDYLESANAYAMTLVDLFDKSGVV